MTWRSAPDRERLSGASVGWLTSAYAGAGIRGANVPATGSNGHPSPIYNDLVFPGDANKEYSWRIVTPPSAGTFQPYEDGSFYYLGPSTTFTYQLYENYVAVGSPTLVTITSGGSVTLSGAAPVESLGHAGTFTPASVGAVTLSGAAPVQSLGHAGTFTPATGGAVTLSGAAAVESLSHNGVFTPSATSATVARPSTTLSNAGWIPSAGVALPAMINEAAPNDADFIYASGAGNTCEIGLSATAHPGASQQIVRYRAQSVLGGLGVIVSLKQGATVIASWTHTTLPTAMTTFERTLTPPQIALIAPGPVSLELTTI